MLSSRTETVLKTIVRQYIEEAVPVASQSIVGPSGLEVSSATLRNEMAYLEREGYLLRPHTSAGSIPSDKGYRYYVETLEDIQLPLSEQRLVSHLFHQVERRLEEWLSLTARLIAELVQTAVVVTTPKAKNSRLKHLELVSLRDSLVLMVLIFHGAKIKQQLITFDKLMSASEMVAVSDKLNTAYSGLNRSQIPATRVELSPVEQQITDTMLEIMEAEDEQEAEEPYLDGMHYMFNQPEFAQSKRLQALMELVEHRNLLKLVTPQGLTPSGVRVIIGHENEAEAVQDCSIVITRYGLLHETSGTICVFGPTRIPYARAISSVGYLSTLLSQLVAELYEGQSS